jgi:hypothetical protein
MIDVQSRTNCRSNALERLVFQDGVVLSEAWLGVWDLGLGDLEDKISTRKDPNRLNELVKKESLVSLCNSILLSTNTFFVTSSQSLDPPEQEASEIACLLASFVC